MSWGSRTAWPTVLGVLLVLVLVLVLVLAMAVPVALALTGLCVLVRRSARAG